jgi:ferredoxin-thioredoxin reductase catalytic subunit
MATGFENTYRYLLVEAEKHNVSLNETCPDFTGDVEYMASRWEGNRPPCNCKNGVKCPCGKMEMEVERDGVCYCGIFIKKAV